MPDQNITDRLIPVHVVETIVRARAGFRFWFSYDENMSLAAASQLVPDPEFVTVARIPQRRLTFNTQGQPCLIPRANHCIHGVIWRVSEPGMAGLDIRLGVPSQSLRNGALCRSPTGRPVLAEYYTPRLQAAGKVSQAVLEPILAAATQLEFPALYLDQLAQWSRK